MVRRDTRQPACLALATAFFVATSAGAAGKAAGGADRPMISLHATIERGGAAGPDTRGFVVSWKGAEPVMVLSINSRDQEHPERIHWWLDPVFRGPGLERRLSGDLFPYTVDAQSPPGNDDYYKVDRVMQTFTADLDGDGTEEFVLLRKRGGITVLDRRQVAWQRPSRPFSAVGGYEFVQSQRARLAGGDALFLLFRRELGSAYRDPAQNDPKLVSAGLTTPSLLVRVDGKGDTFVDLEDTGAQPFGFAVLTTPDQTVDAIAVFGRREGSSLIANLHDASGKRIAGPWELEAPPVYPGFDRVVVANGLPIVGAEAQLNHSNFWLLDLNRASPRAAHFEVYVPASLATLVATPQPMAVLLLSAGNGGIDIAGKLWRRDKGAWAQVKDTDFVVKLTPPGPDYDQARAFASFDGSDQYLVVQSRHHQDRKMEHGELVAAAEKFLPPVEVSDLQAVSTEPRYDDNRFPREEGPSAALDRELKDRLTWPLRHPDALSAPRYRNVEAFRAWLTDSDLHARTVLTLFRAGRPVSRAEVDGWNDTWNEKWPVDWRVQGDGFVAVLPLKTANTTEPWEKEVASFHVVHAQPPAAQ